MVAQQPSGQATKRYHHGDLHRALLEVARAEIAAKGAQAVSLSSLARAAGVSQPAPYRHFADREALLSEVATQGFQEFTTLLHAVAEAEPDDIVRSMARAYIDFGERNIELYRLMFASRLVPLADEQSDLARAADESFAPLVAAVAGAKPEVDATTEATAIWAQLHGFMMLKADGFIREPLSSWLDKVDC